MPDAVADKRLDYIKAWQSDNPDKVREYKRRHKERKRDERVKADPSYEYKPLVVYEPEERKRRKRARRLMDDYQLSHDEYEAMHAAQGGLCLICGRPETTKSRTGAVRLLAVDHDHDTGKVRGLLCNACNTGIGYFREDIESLKSAVKYLETHHAG